MPDISRSVGRGGRNDDADTTIVQCLLNATPTARGGAQPPLDIDGWCGDRTIGAIRHFQSVQLPGFQDGLVEPGRKTIGLLNAAAIGPGARAVPLPDLDPAELARRDAPQAAMWGTPAQTAIKGLIAHVEQTGSVGGFDAIAETALASHFHINQSTSRATALDLLGTIQRNYAAALVEIAGGMHYRSVSRREMRADFAGVRGSGDVPGYTPFVAPRRICWSPLFHSTRAPSPGNEWTGAGFGPKCRAAMVLHEAIHFVDASANFDTYEWGPEYTVLPATRAVHNASSYPSFGAHVYERSGLPLGPRYGAGRPTE